MRQMICEEPGVVAEEPIMVAMEPGVVAGGCCAAEEPGVANELGAVV